MTRRKYVLSVAAVLICVGLTDSALAQKGPTGPSLRKGAGLWCQTCAPVKAAVFDGQRTAPGDFQPSAFTEQQTTMIYSPSEMTYLRTPASQVVGGELYLTTQNGSGTLTPTTLITSPSFVSPGAFTAELDFSVDLYCAGGSQQVGFYYAFWIDEDLGSGFCNNGASCGYLIQNTLFFQGNPFRFGVSGVVYQQTPVGDTNMLVSETIPYTISTVPGATYRVRVDVWPFHFFVNSPQWIGWGSTRLRISKGPGGVCQ